MHIAFRRRAAGLRRGISYKCVSTWGWFSDKIGHFPPIRLRCHTAALRSSGRLTNTFCLFDMRAIKPYDGDIIATHYTLCGSFCDILSFGAHSPENWKPFILITIYSVVCVRSAHCTECTPRSWYSLALLQLWWKVILMLTELCAPLHSHTHKHSINKP